MAKVVKGIGKSNLRVVKTTQDTMERINLKAAGIDVGSESITVAVLDKPVVTFRTHTPDLEKAVKYLKENQISSVVMEATGIYWLPIYEMLEKENFPVTVANGAYAKNVPGRKTDVQDAEWLRELHTYGLLSSSFIPADKIRELRYYVRLRDDHISMSATHVNIIIKNLDAMNLKLHKVISDVMGVSGQKVLRAILAGKRNPEELLKLCTSDIQIKKGEDVISSLTGNYRNEYIFGIRQAMQLWDHYQLQIQSCDTAIEALLKEMTKDIQQPEKIEPTKQIRHHAPQIDDFHTMMVKLCGGKDPTKIPGINDMSLLRILSETGVDFSKWANEKAFTSWLGLTPKVDRSGKQKRKRHWYVFNKAGQAFRMMAQAVGNGKYSALSSFYKRIRSRAGAKIAVKATARKIAVYFYNLMTKGLAFVEEGIKRYEERYHDQQTKYLKKKAAEMGFELVAI